MKNLSFLLMFSMSLFFGCRQQAGELTEAEKTLIEQEIRNIMNQTLEAIKIHDVDKIMEHCLKNEDYLYSANGFLTKGFDENYKIASTIHSDPDNQSFFVNYEDLIIKVINRDCVMVVGDGYFKNIQDEDGSKSIRLAITFLFEKIDGQWLLTVGHESTPEMFL
jgi:ketosteroid isomerase-like protein